MLPISTLASASTIFGLRVAPEAPTNTEPFSGPQCTTPQVKKELPSMGLLTLGAVLCLTPALGAAQDVHPHTKVEININTAPAEVIQEVAPEPAQAPSTSTTSIATPLQPAPKMSLAPAPIDEDAPSFSIGVAAGTTHWGPTLAIRNDSGAELSMTFLPIAVDGNFAGHMGLRLTQDFRHRRNASLYGALGVGVTGASLNDSAIAAGVGLGVRSIPQNWERASLWGEVKMTALGGGGEALSVLPLPTVGVSWGF